LIPEDDDERNVSSSSFFISVMPSRILQLCLTLIWALTTTVHAEDPAPPDDHGVGKWIWAAQTHDRQECRFLKRFSIPQETRVESAIMRVTADNSYHLFLDGQPIGQGGDWRSLIEYDVRLLLTPGEHVIGVSALNDFDVAGLILGLRIHFSNGQDLKIDTDESWKISPDDDEHWLNGTGDHLQTAHLVSSPWSNVGLAGPIQTYSAPISRPVEKHFWEGKAFQLALFTITLLSIGIGVFLAMQLYMQQRTEQIIHRERARIAADLHDELGGGLTQLVLLGETSLRRNILSPENDQIMTRMCRDVRELLKNMNESVWLINSLRDNLRDLASYIVKYAEEFFRDTQIRCRFDLDGDIPSLPFDLGLRRNIFLAVKEALNNILKHSDATRVEVKIHRQKDDFMVIIEDNGLGIISMQHEQGDGLRNMQQRADEAGGKCQIVSYSNKGTRIEFRIPIQQGGNWKGSWIFSRKSMRNP
jgi:signal transduction histidine kinase